jgi:hypothetical protein
MTTYPTTKAAPLTRRELQVNLEISGVTGAALECLLWETAEERHQGRVGAAHKAAEEYYLRTVKLERAEVSPEGLEIAAAAILWADVIGIGGRDGVEGAGTARHPAFADCGKGRKQATDGGAWSAAILEAARKYQGSFRVNERGYLTFHHSHMVDEILVDEATVPAPWIYSILREGLRRAAGLRSPHVAWADDMQGAMGLGWHPTVPFDAPPESLAGWAKLVNEVAPVEGPAEYTSQY